MVSPWMKNGDALSYVKKYPDSVNRKFIVSYCTGQCVRENRLTLSFSIRFDILRRDFDFCIHRTHQLPMVISRQYVNKHIYMQILA